MHKLIVAVILSTLAFSTRLIPYSISAYPFNNDGVTEARIAADIVAAGHLSYPADSFYLDTYSVITPVYNVLVAFSSSFFEISTFSISQALVAVFSILTVMAGYVVALRISNSYVGALSAAMALSLLGTFVYLSGSSWKGSLGVAMLMLLTFAYMNRSDKRYLALELTILMLLPLTYHLAAVFACLMLAYLTLWSMINALFERRLGRTHIVDMSIIAIASLAAFAYYQVTSFQRLSELDFLDDILLLLFVFLLLLFMAALVLRRKERYGSRWTFAPAVGSTIAFLVYLDYSNPVFPYIQGFGPNILFLGLMYSIFVALAWFGLEKFTRSSSRYRAIPLGLLLPVLTLILFATISGFSLLSHKIFYRTFDYATLSLAMGLSVSIAAVIKERIKLVTVIVLISILLATLPFAYMTGPLVGIRHDTQQYEVDAIAWVSANFDMPLSLSSDERLTYDAQALYDFGKNPYLPSILESGNLSRLIYLNLLLEEWLTIGVNDYPRGRPVPDKGYVSYVLAFSDVFYIGGPASNKIVVFELSEVASPAAP